VCAHRDHPVSERPVGRCATSRTALLAQLAELLNLPLRKPAVLEARGAGEHSGDELASRRGGIEPASSATGRRLLLDARVVATRGGGFVVR
jgi:hypothetical protein